MSKKRSISRKINLVEFPLPESSKILPNPDRYNDTCIQEIYFGEEIKSESDSSTAAKSDSSDIFEDALTSDDGLRDLLSYKSSASSTSGSEDIECEATKKIAQEFEKLENILYGNIDETHKEIDEYNEWTGKFPHLRIIGSAMTIHPSNEGLTEEFIEEIIEEHSDSNILLEESPPDTKSKLKEAVINNVLKKVKSQLSNKSRESYRIFSIPDISVPRSRKSSENKESNELSSNESFLQITTMPLNSSPFRKINFDYQSPIMKSHLSASKWQKDDSSGYSSLPHISHSSVPYNSSGNKKNQALSANKSDKNVHRYSANSRNTSGTSVARLHSKYTYSPRVKNVVLPPIQNLCLDDGRSVSSTPRKFNTRPVSSKLNKYSDEKPRSYLNVLDKN